MSDADETKQGFEQLVWDGFSVSPHPDGGYAVYIDVPALPDGDPSKTRLGFTLVASDHHAAISVAHMFNRTVRGAFVAPTDSE